MKDWVKMPTDWIRNKEAPPLAKLRWKGENKAAQIAALMLYLAIV